MVARAEAVLAAQLASLPPGRAGARVRGSRPIDNKKATLTWTLELTWSWMKKLRDEGEKK